MEPSCTQSTLELIIVNVPATIAAVAALVAAVQARDYGHMAVDKIRDFVDGEDRRRPPPSSGLPNWHDEAI